jgi:hypothetical protein
MRSCINIDFVVSFVGATYLSPSRNLLEFAHFRCAYDFALQAAMRPAAELHGKLMFLRLSQAILSGFAH